MLILFMTSAGLDLPSHIALSLSIDFPWQEIDAGEKKQKGTKIIRGRESSSLRSVSILFCSLFAHAHFACSIEFVKDHKSHFHSTDARPSFLHRHRRRRLLSGGFDRPSVIVAGRRSSEELNSNNKKITKSNQKSVNVSLKQISSR